MDACDVLVVGAGPTGQTAAAVLGAAGVRVRLIDAAPERSDRSRALVVQPRTLELLDRIEAGAGSVGHALAQVGRRTMGTNLNVDGERVMHVDLGVLAFDDTPFPFILFVSQHETERLLDRALSRLGVEVERPVRLCAFEQTARGVVCALEGPRGREEVLARWVIGADGAHSTVRKGLGLSFEGAAYPSDFLLGDVRLDDTGLSPDEIHIFLARDGFAAVFPLPGHRVRLMTTAARPGAREEPLSLDELLARVSSIAGRPLPASDAGWLARFHLHHRGVHRYRVGRAFVAGDAAHIHSPAGGQGMNTGIQDAFNLAWKLAAVVRGEAPVALLDTYEAERQPVGARLLHFTDRAFSLATSDNQLFTGVRNLVLPWIAPTVATTANRERVIRFVSQLNIRYRSSPLNGEDIAAPFHGGPRPGERAPAVQQAFPSAMRGLGWALLAFCGVEERAVPPERFVARLEGACAGYPVRVSPVVAASSDAPAGLLHAAYGLAGPGVYLVRPDGHVAFRSGGDRADPVARYLDAHLAP